MKLKSDTEVDDTWDMLLERGVAKNIMLLPGHAFIPSKSSSFTSPYMRAAFSIAEEKNFDIAFQRLAQLIQEEGKKKVDT